MASPGADPRHTHAYRLFAAMVRRSEGTCWLCQQPIDRALPYRDPSTGRVNRDCWTLDHVVPVADRPDLALRRANARAAHLRCNTARGKRPPRREERAGSLTTSRSWF